MAKLNITQAAQAVGKHRSTLQRHIKDGTLSVEKDGTGNPSLDVAELQRVYGRVEIATDATPPQNATVRQSDAGRNDAETRVLRVKLEAAEKERDEALRREQEEKERHRETRENRDRLLGIIEEQAKTIAALPKPATQEEARPLASAQEPAPKRSLWGRLFGKGA